EHYIETISKRGYRFVAGVKEIWSDQAVPVVSEGGEEGEVIPTDEVANQMRRNQLALGVLHGFSSGGVAGRFSSLESTVANRKVLVPAFLALCIGLIG